MADITEVIRDLTESEAKASPMPWSVDEGEVEEGVWFRHIDGWKDTGGGNWLCLSPEDAALVVKNRNSLPRVLEYIKSLQRERDHYHSAFLNAINSVSESCSRVPHCIDTIAHKGGNPPE